MRPFLEEPLYGVTWPEPPMANDGHVRAAQGAWHCDAGDVPANVDTRGYRYTYLTVEAYSRMCCTLPSSSTAAHQLEEKSEPTRRTSYHPIMTSS